MTALSSAGDRRGTIQSVDRAARILRALGSSPRLGVTEISDRLGIAKATVHGLLRTLEGQELVEQDAESGKYRLGPAMLQLGNSFLDNHELRARSLMWAGSLATRVGEAVRVGVMNGATVLIVHHVFRPDNSVQILEVGASIPWHACALGKAVVAFGPPSRRNALLGGELSPLTGRTQTERIGAADRARGRRRRSASRWRIRRRSSARPRSRRRCSIIAATLPVRSASWDRSNASSRTGRRRR